MGFAFFCENIDIFLRFRESERKDRGVVDVKNEFTVNLLEDKGAYVAQIRNSNPYSKGIDSIKTYVKVPKHEGRWSVGVGGGYDGFSGKIAPMIGIQYKLFNLPF